MTASTKATGLKLAPLLLLGWAAPALGNGRVVVVPIAVGAGPDQASGLVGSVGEGLASVQPRWKVDAGAALRDSGSATAPATEADWSRLGAQLEGAPDPTAAPVDAAAALEPLRLEIRRAFDAGPPNPRGADLLFRAGGRLAAAWQAAGDADKARAVAAETALLFPGRKATPDDRIPPAAVELLATPAGTGRLRIVTHPDACPVSVNGQAAGNAPVDLPAAAGGVYWSEARCPGHAPVSRRLLPTSEATAHQEVLDAEFEAALDRAADPVLRFASNAERQRLEEGYARRTAEEYGAEIVVFVSSGELGGQDMVRARLYRNNGFLVREGLARLEATRAKALGSYLGSGKTTPGVLRPDEAAALALAAHGTGTHDQPQAWYRDWIGWTLAGVGVAGLATGVWMNNSAAAKQRQADEVRGDPGLQDDLRQQASQREFYSYFALGIGGALTIAGIMLLVIPDNTSGTGALMTFDKTPGGGLARLTVHF